jgi:hypothetical protein
MRIVWFFCLWFGVIIWSSSCKKETIADYIPFQKDTINNPEGYLEDYGKPFSGHISESFFNDYNWKIRVVSDSLPEVIFYNRVNSYSLKVYEPNNPSLVYNTHFDVYQGVGFQIDYKYMDYRFYGRWTIFGDTNKLIFAKRGVSIFFTKR